ncbi:phosphocholine-specific phospholipase C [Acrocarpospora catenulata]|uniref:phosphocholine-specific phospholipase C n=1 Tax=Acrocarpospora catenulata TaxID=2836182 RepID=UPI001BDA3715|nr:phospholipase C, phosphocholine-specific [Acrocarpospora catenulata]
MELSDSVANAAAIGPDVRTGTIDDVEHIVVLMQENRSFDQYFGTLGGVRGFGDPRPVVLPSGKPVWYQSDGAREVLPFRPDGGPLGGKFLEELDHEWNSGHVAFNEGRYDRWIPAKTPGTMAYLTREDLPFHYALADAFTVCDAFHCSVLGPTDPNRFYMWTGHTGNDGNGGGPVLQNDQLGYGWTTYPERLERAGISWKIYQDVGDGLDAAGNWGWTHHAPYIGNYGSNSLLFFTSYREAGPGDPLYEKARTGTNAKAGEGLFDHFRADVLNGRLPQVSWLAPPEAYSEHPNWPADYGAWYIAQTLDALTANPEVWSRTVLLVTYDENDGFFDHVVPPYPAASPERGASTVPVTGEIYTGGGDFLNGPYGLGVRVPMIVVSPWSRGGWVCSEVFDLTSIIRFMEARFGVYEPGISPWRRAVCGDLTSAFDFTRADLGPLPLPDTTAMAPRDRERHPDHVSPLPADPALPRQEPGLRPARALPYDLRADGRTTPDGAFTIEFESRGPAGAVFYVTSPDGGPWTYTVESGKSLTATWPAGPYDLTVHGPNGFLRTFTGQPGDLETTLGSGTLVITGAPCEITITDGYGTTPPATYHLTPDTSVTHPVPLTGWYDLTVTSPTATRRLAGHVENGEPSRSDPGIIAEESSRP